MGNIVTYITPKLIEESDLSIFDDLDDVYAQVNELKSASTKLVSGSKELKEGTNTLNSGATELQKGITSARTEKWYQGTYATTRSISDRMK